MTDYHDWVVLDWCLSWVTSVFPLTMRSSRHILLLHSYEWMQRSVSMVLWRLDRPLYPSGRVFEYLIGSIFTLLLVLDGSPTVHLDCVDHSTSVPRAWVPEF